MAKWFKYHNAGFPGSLYLAILVFLFTSLSVSAQNVLWARHFGSIGVDFCTITSDNQNNIYVGGSYYHDCFLSNDTLHSLGKNDLFLAKYDDLGNELWSKTLGGLNPNSTGLGSDLEEGGELIFDSIGNCLYFVGNFFSTLQIDDKTIISSGERDVFLAKFSLDGSCEWLKKAGSTGDDRIGLINIGTDGAIYWSGNLELTGYIDTIEINFKSFYAKLTNDGQIQWIRGLLNTGTLTNSIVKSDYLYFTGYFSGNITIDTISLNCNQGSDFFAGKYNLATNHVLWLKQFSGGTELTNNVLALLLKDNNNIYMYGTFQDSIDIDGTKISNYGHSEIYYLRVDSTGNINWIYQCHTLDNQYWAPGQLRSGRNNSIYASGTFNTRAILGNDTITTNKETVYITKFDSTGQFVGTITFREAKNTGLTILSDGSFAVCGGQINMTEIGDTIFYNFPGSLTNRDNYIAKFDAITGIQNISKPGDNKLFIYANPTTGLCQIDIPVEFENEKNLTLLVYDQLGRLLKQSSISMEADPIKLNLEALAKGMYTAILSNGKKQYTGKIIFQ